MWARRDRPPPGGDRPNVRGSCRLLSAPVGSCRLLSAPVGRLRDDRGTGRSYGSGGSYGSYGLGRSRKRACVYVCVCACHATTASARRSGSRACRRPVGTVGEPSSVGRPPDVHRASSARTVQYTYSKPVFCVLVVYGQNRVPVFRQLECYPFLETIKIDEIRGHGFARTRQVHKGPVCCTCTVLDEYWTSTGRALDAH